MAVIETKFSIGDVVYHAGTTTERKQHPCPDCLGERKWAATSPAGGEYTFACPRCSARFLGNNDLSLDYTAHVARASKLTIGSIQTSTGSRWDAGGNRYMCVETGVGSGAVYDEGRLFTTEAEALRCAEGLAAVANAEIKHIVDRYNQSLDISDYQIENAELLLARRGRHETLMAQWNIGDLFDAIEGASSKGEAAEALHDYRRDYAAKDREEVAAAILAAADEITNAPIARATGGAA